MYKLTKIKLKVGDLVVVRESRAMGGVSSGTIGLVTKEIPGVAANSPGTARIRWHVQWFAPENYAGTTFGNGLEVISEGS